MTEHPTARPALYLPPSNITQLLDASGVSNRSVFGRDASDGAPHVSDILANERTVETDGLANFRTYGPFRLKEESSSGSGFAVCRYRLSPLLGSRVTPKKKMLPLSNGLRTIRVVSSACDDLSPSSLPDSDR